MEPDYIDEENRGKHYIEELAKEVAALTKNWDPRDILSDEDLVSFAETLIALRARAIESLKTMPPIVTGVVCAAFNQKGLHLSKTLYGLPQPRQTPQPESASLMEVDIPAEVRKRS